MIKEFTPLRFALCMMILFHHVFHYAAGGTAAVAAFFILSGFCMTLGYRERVVNGTLDYFEFVKKRMVKIFPIHWITLSVWLVLAFMLKDGCGVNVRTLPANVFLLQSWIPSPKVYFSYNDISWYLSTALFAYLCFPLLMQLLCRLNKKRSFISVGVLLLVYAIVVIAMPSANRHAMLYINPSARLLDFILGMFMANWYMNKDWNINKRYNILIDVGIILAFVALNVVGILASESMRLIAAIYWAPSLFLILLISISAKTSTCLCKMFSLPIIQRATQCAFSLMMWSTIGINILQELNVANGVWGGAIIFFGMYIMAQCSYYLIEIKLTKLIK